MQVEDWPLSRIIRYERNPRKRSKKSVAKIAASIKEFGPRQPIVVDDAGVILVGHGRLDGAELLAMETFPVHQALGLSEQQNCYGLEIEPRYCDVIVARWEKFTGKTAVLERREVAA